MVVTGGSICITIQVTNDINLNPPVIPVFKEAFKGVYLKEVYTMLQPSCSQVEPGGTYKRLKERYKISVVALSKVRGAATLSLLSKKLWERSL